MSRTKNNAKNISFHFWLLAAAQKLANARKNCFARLGAATTTVPTPHPVYTPMWAEYCLHSILKYEMGS